MDINIRSARPEDQETIVSFIRQAGINPRNLYWQNFLFTEEAGKPVGIRHIKIYPQSTLEVASGFVLPEYRHRGSSAQLMEALHATERIRIVPLKGEQS